MDIAALIEQMREYDPDRRRSAARELVAAGPQAVGPLVAALHDGRGFAHGYAEVLRQVGDPAFGPLVDALVRTPTPRAYDGTPSSTYAVGLAFTRLHVSDREMFATAAGHDSGDVRAWACLAFAEMGADAAPYIPRIVPLLADGHPDVRWAACRVVGRHTDASSAHLPALLALLTDPVDVVRREAGRAIGPELVPRLRAMRRAPGRHRGPALAALAETVGWPGLDPADRALVRRLIRVRSVREVPEPFEPHGQWYALPTGDRPAVLDAFGLSDPMPVTMRLGRAAVTRGHIQRGEFAYVTPVLDGWTLVFVWDGGFEEHTATLSRRFGTAHAYIDWDDHHGGGYTTGWCIAEHGTVVRCYINQEGCSETGDPHPAEHSCLLPHEDGGDTDVCYATDIAARVSVSPTGIGPHTRVEGSALVALTARGRRDGVTPAALPV